MNESIQEEVYMSQSLGFEKQDSTLVCKLNKALYVLEQASRVWYEKLSQAFIQFDFIHPRCDHSLFIYSNKGITMYDLVYVEDILITWSFIILTYKLIDFVHVTSSLKNLYISCMLLTQTKFI